MRWRKPAANNWKACPRFCCNSPSRICSLPFAASSAVGSCRSSNCRTAPPRPVLIGPLMSPGFMLNATAPVSAMRPNLAPGWRLSPIHWSSKWRPSAFAAFFRSCSPLPSPTVLASFVRERLGAIDLVSASNVARISSKVGVAGRLHVQDLVNNVALRRRCALRRTFVGALKMASINCGAMPTPGSVSVRVTKLLVMTSRPLACAAFSNPCVSPGSQTCWPRLSARTCAFC